MRIQSIATKHFPPFHDSEIDFPGEKEERNLAEVQILTGQNGCGKTRLLCVLAAALGNSQDLDLRAKRNGDSDFLVWAEHENSELCTYWSHNFSWFQKKIVDRSTDRTKGFVEPNRLINFSGLGNIKNLLKDPFSAQAYRGTGRVADVKIEAMKPVALGKTETFLCFDRPASDDQVICQGMANLKMVSAMEHQGGVDPSQARATKIVTRFEQAIQQISGRKFTFLVKPQPEIHLVVKWGEAEMYLNAMPDGLRSIIAWLISCISKLDAQYPNHADPLDLPLILLLDEPESHLHPEWQRRLLPTAQRIFPNAQIFVATHSPFVISSVNSGWIHKFRFNSDSQVEASRPSRCSKGDTYIDAIEDVLGVTTWYDPETEDLLDKFRRLRLGVLESKIELVELEKLAKEISSRSESLSDLMSREMSQLSRQIRQSEAMK